LTGNAAGAPRKANTGYFSGGYLKQIIQFDLKRTQEIYKKTTCLTATERQMKFDWAIMFYDTRGRQISGFEIEMNAVF
jgi:hypothetical protein